MGNQKDGSGSGPKEDTREQTVKLLEDKSVGSLRIAKRKLFQSGIDDGRSTIHQIAKKEEKDTKNDEESLY